MKLILGLILALNLSGQLKADTPTFTATATLTNCPVINGTPYCYKTYTFTSTYTVSKTVTKTISPTFTKTYTASPTPTITPTVTKTVTKTATPTFTSTITKTATPTFTSTATPTATPSNTPTSTPTPVFISGIYSPVPVYPVRLSDGATWTPPPTPQTIPTQIPVSNSVSGYLTGAGQSITLTVSGMGGILVGLSTTSVTGNTIQFYGSNDLINWTSHNGVKINGGSLTTGNTGLAAGLVYFEGGYNYFSVCMTAQTVNYQYVNIVTVPSGVLNKTDLALINQVAVTTGATADGQTSGLQGMSLWGHVSGTNNKQRIADTFKTVEAAANTSTAIWTPASGKKFRLMAYQIMITDEANITGSTDLVVGFNDSTTALGTSADFYMPNLSVTTAIGGVYPPVVNLGNGILSSTQNNSLCISLSTALTSGKVRVNVWGTEEANAGE